MPPRCAQAWHEQDQAWHEFPAGFKVDLGIVLAGGGQGGVPLAPTALTRQPVPASSPAIAQA